MSFPKLTQVKKHRRSINALSLISLSLVPLFTLDKGPRGCIYCFPIYFLVTKFEDEILVTFRHELPGFFRFSVEAAVLK